MKRLKPDIWQIADDDCLALEQLFAVYRPKRVLEFGPGRSTLLWLHLGCEVDALEHDPAQLARQTKLFHGLDRVRLHGYKFPADAPLPHGRYDLVFVDGPPGALYARCARLDAVLFALDRSDVVLLHDARRAGEQETVAFVRERGYRTGFVDTPAGIAVMCPATKPSP